MQQIYFATSLALRYIEVPLNIDATCMDGVSTSHDGTAGWCTNVLHIIVIENDSIVCQTIQIWSWDLR